MTSQWRKNNIEKIRKYNLQWQIDNRESHNESNRKYRATHPEVGIIYRAQKRAKKMELDFNLDLEDIVIPEICPVLGIPIFRNTAGVSGACENSPALDRIDNSKGYVKGNVCVISSRANRIKSDATVNELEAIIKYMNGSQD